MAGTDKFEDLKLSDLSLDPLPDPNIMNLQVATKPATANPNAKPRPSGGTDRRDGKERRKTLRFEADRRTGKDRRPRKGFDLLDPGTDPLRR